METTLISQNATARPYLGIYIKAAHRWFRALDIHTAVADFCDWRDMNGLGASDIGGQFPLYRMNASGTDNKQIGTVAYNGNVRSTEVIA